MGGWVAKHGPQLLLSALSFGGYKIPVINILLYRMFSYQHYVFKTPLERRSILMDFFFFLRKQGGMVRLSEN